MLGHCVLAGKRGVFLYAGHLNSLRRRRFQLCSRILSAEEEGGDFFKTEREGREKESNFNALRTYGKKSQNRTKPSWFEVYGRPYNL